jgi:folate-dependent phosphoribosylglycinamide formyltransferase PurN
MSLKIINVNMGIVASGSGTTANVIMKNFGKNSRPVTIKKIKRKELPAYGQVVCLISTNEKARCILRAVENKIETRVIKEGGDNREWNRRLRKIVREYKIRLLILAGCVKQVDPIPGVVIINTHPAKTYEHGGRKMYGLAVHRHVLVSLRDAVMREMLEIKDARTTINFHYVIEGMDKGESIVQVHIKVPESILGRFMSGKLKLGKAAELLQQHVLQYEYAMLPSAVDIAILNVVNKSEEGRIKRALKKAVNL